MQTTEYSGCKKIMNFFVSVQHGDIAGIIIILPSESPLAAAKPSIFLMDKRVDNQRDPYPSLPQVGVRTSDFPILVE